jgi:PAS domain S-box-containing protein
MVPLDLTAAIVPDPLVVTPTTTLRAAIAQMSHARAQCQLHQAAEPNLAHMQAEARASCVLVVVDQQVVGIVTERDVVRLSLQAHTFGDLTFDAVMTPNVVTLRQADIKELFYALQLMRQHRIRHLPVVDDGDRLVGLITHESLRYITRPVDLLRARLVSEVMTPTVVRATAEETVLAVAQRMVDHRVSCVVVVEPMASGVGDRPVGILTERDLLQFHALGLQPDLHQVAAVMSTPVLTVSPHESLWRVQDLMANRWINRLAVTGDQGELLGIVTQSSVLQGLNPLEIYKMAEALEAQVHRLEAEKLALLEERNAVLEQQVAARTQALQTQTQRERLLRDLATQIRASLNLRDILDTTVQQVRHILGCDRVTILQFDAQWHSLVVAESTDLPHPLLGERLEDHCFQAEQAELYRQGRVRVVPDIYTTEMSDCHRDLLIRLQTRAKILVPLLCGDDLWGVLNVSESQHPRPWSDDEVALLKALAVQLAIAIQQATHHEQLQRELQERQQAEDTLRRTFHRLESAQRIAHLGSWELDHSTQSLRWSAEVFRIFELDPHTVTPSYESFLDCIHPDDRAAVHQAYQRHLRDREPYNLTHRLRLPDGRIKYVQEQCETRYGDPQTPLVSLGTVQDITALKQAEQALAQLNSELEDRVAQRTLALREREAQLRDLFDNANDLIQSVTLADGRFEYVNRAWRSTLGYTEAEVADLTIFDVLHPDCHGHCRRALAQAQAADAQNEKAGEIAEMDRIELTFLSKTGHAVVVEGSLNLRCDQGQPVATRAIFRDITRRKWAEKQLRDREARYRALLDGASDAIFIADAEGNIQEVNRQGLALLGYTYGEILSMSFEDCHPEVDRPRLRSLFQTLLAGHPLPGPVDVDFLCKDGRPLAAELTMAALDIEGGPVIQGIFRDIRDRKQYEATLEHTNQELRRATRMKDEFLANMSHELRTPLNAILGMTEALQEQVFGEINPKQNRSLDTIYNSGNHLLALINDILDVAKIEAGQMDLDLTLFSVHSLCQSSLVFVKQQALKKNLHLITDLPPQGVRVYGDERRLRQVLINLLNNAVKFTPAGGQITLAVKPLVGADSPIPAPLQFAVIDTGMGISPADQAKLFQPFVQVDSALNRKYEGTGLGLALVKRIVELHGGAVALTSTLGVGSCFSLTLPPPPPDRGAANGPLVQGRPVPIAPAGSEPVPQNPLILLVEDQPDNIDTLLAYLQARGYRLLVAHNGQEALTLTQQQVPDVILMDIQMPDMDGLEATRRLRHRPALAQVPIIALTALAMEGDRDRCLGAGANDYLSKPVRLKMLNDTIQTWLQRAPSTPLSRGCPG